MLWVFKERREDHRLRKGPTFGARGHQCLLGARGSPGALGIATKPALSLFRVLLRMKDGSQAGDLLIQQANTTGFYKAAASRQAEHRLPFLARFCHLLAAP